MQQSTGGLGGFASVSVKLYVIPKHCSLNFKDDGYITLLNWCFNDVLFDDAHNEMSMRMHDTIAIVRVTSQVIFTPLSLLCFSAPSPSSALAISSAALLRCVLLLVLI